MKKFWREGSKNIGNDHHWTRKLFSLNQNSALDKFAQNVHCTNYLYFWRGSHNLIVHFVQYMIVKATYYPPPRMTIVCARYIPCKKKKVMEIVPEVVVELLKLC
jgi:hypothetical protein